MTKTRNNFRSKNGQNQKEKSTHGTLRVKQKTKDAIDIFLKEKVNTDEDLAKVTVDNLVTFLLEKMTKEDIKALQVSSLTWKHESKRIKKLWETKKGKVTPTEWEAMLYSGQLFEFIKKHSRISVNLQ